MSAFECLLLTIVILSAVALGMRIERRLRK